MHVWFCRSVFTMQAGVSLLAMPFFQAPSSLQMSRAAEVSYFCAFPLQELREQEGRVP